MLATFRGTPDLRRLLEHSAARAISLARVHITHSLFGRTYCRSGSAPSLLTHTHQVLHALFFLIHLFLAYTFWHAPHCSRILIITTTTRACYSYTITSRQLRHDITSATDIVSVCTPRQYDAAPCAIRYNLHYWHAPTHTLLIILCVAVHVKYGTPVLCAY